MKDVGVGCMKGYGVWWIVIMVFVIVRFEYFCEGCVKEERVMLLRIKDNLNYPNGSSLSNEWVGEDCCYWYGVICDNHTSHVIKISLFGTRAYELGTWKVNISLFAQFKELETLNLGFNQIGGFAQSEGFNQLKNLKALSLCANELRNVSLSGLCQLMNMRVLYLCENQLEDDDLPSCLWNLTKLEGLSLWGNNLRGDFWISTGLCRLMNLRSLYLSSNKLQDKHISPCLWNLTKLEGLDLGNNNLKGYFGISTGICNLRKLTWLDLTYNAIEGRIPPCFGQLHSLISLGLSNNQLDGVVNLSMFANLSSLSGLSLSYNPLLEVESEGTTWEPTFQLSALDLSNCKVNTRGGRGIPSFLSTQYQLLGLYLSQSNLVGEIPLPLFRNMTTLKILELSHNSLNGSFPTNFTLHFPKLEILDLSGNGWAGPLPPFLGDSLQLVDLSNNKFNGGIPVGASSLVSLKLSNNRLIGEMIPTNWNMTTLRLLYLDGNEFTSTSSHGLPRNNSVMTLDISKNSLSREMPNWLPTTFPNLHSLLLGKNNFTGHIPTTYCQLQSLHLLDLSHNSLSGSIPPCFNNITSWKNEDPVDGTFTANYAIIKSKANFTTKGNEYTYESLPLSLMTGIDLSMNRLTGKIPSELGSLKCLHSLNLSHNLLTGPIPESFTNMEQLESLDLSHNRLNGRIPQELTQLHFLSTFIVASNNLSGPIPFKEQFGTFNESSYTDNPDLCGKPLEKNCSFRNSSEPGNTGEEDEEDQESLIDNPVIFYSFVAMSFALGFWGFIALLIFKRSWRFKYFTAADRYIETCEEKVSDFVCRLKTCFCNP